MVSLVPYDSSFLELSWQWLNDPEITRLTHTADFTREDQQKWFNKIPSLKGYKIWGIQHDGEKVGVCGIKNITGDDCEYWGYIGVKTMWSKGIGTIAMAKNSATPKKARMASSLKCGNISTLSYKNH